MRSASTRPATASSPSTSWLLAGRTGIGPFLAILRIRAGWQNYRCLIVVHSFRQAAELFAAELDPHFCIEERGILLRLAQAGRHELVQRTLDEHAKLRRLAKQLTTPDAGTLLRFATLLGTHIRFEEREVFEATQASLDVYPAPKLEAHT